MPIEEAIALASKHPNVFLGTSAYAPKYWRPEMVRFLDSRRGRDKVLWGTDWPSPGVREMRQNIDQFLALSLDDSHKRAILETNALALFPAAR